MKNSKTKPQNLQMLLFDPDDQIHTGGVNNYIPPWLQCSNNNNILKKPGGVGGASSPHAPLSQFEKHELKYWYEKM